MDAVADRLRRGRARPGCPPPRGPPAPGSARRWHRPGSSPASRPMIAAPWPASARSPSAASIASAARPKALMGALTTLVSPRLFPVRESPMTIEGRSCATRRPVLDQGAVGLDRRHRLRQLVEVVVEVAREDERVLLGDRAPLAAVDVRGLDGDVAHEGGAGRRAARRARRRARCGSRARWPGSDFS